MLTQVQNRDYLTNTKAVKPHTTNEQAPCQSEKIPTSRQQLRLYKMALRSPRRTAYSPARSPARSPRFANKQQQRIADKLVGAAKKGDLRGVQDAIHDGAQIDMRNNFGWTALTIAASKNQIGMVKYLIEDLKANVNQRNKEGNTALLCACTMDDNIETVGMIVVSVLQVPYFRKAVEQEAVERLVLAASQGDLTTASEELKIFPNIVNMCDENQRTALINACQFKRLKFVQFLILEAKADLNFPGTGRKRTPLMFAVQSNVNLDMVKILIENKAVVTIFIIQ
eukprot:jgi/Bigna1/136037/aug1.32_g10745